ncbi:hypothetical protein JKA73_17675 [Myxococcus xanthus]|uniref:hypothetical protein n=1 Tax=Myxococcus xanthus TaxID=34 RepID=UPI0019174388|nr:hypothetical protein [Myxococcus xanthus]QQR47766.1 hypothetical protein JKA73_17675 [Myxococcus xanthus]
MTDDLKDFARPVLRGSRFDDHAIPVSALRELNRYGELLSKVAVRLYKARTKSDRAPRGFESSFQLKLRDVEHNCATPVLAIPSVLPPDLAELGVLSDYEASRELVSRTIKAAMERRALPPEFPADCLVDLEQLGASLGDHETIELRGPNAAVPGPVYDSQTRIFLRQARQAPAYIKIAAFTGAVAGFSDTGAFELRVHANGRRFIKCRSDIGIEAKVIAALKGRRFLRARVSGQTKFSGTGVAEEVQQVLDFRVWSRTSEAEMKQVEHRLDELAALPAGWLEGSGEALSPKDLVWLRERILVWLMAEHGLPRPLLYAMPDGGVQVVWRALPWRVEAEFNLLQRTVALIAVNVDTDEDADDEFDVKSPEDEVRLLDFVTKYIPTVEEQPYRPNEGGR